MDTSALFAILAAEEDAPVIARRAIAASRLFMSAATSVELAIVVFSRWGEEGLHRLAALSQELRIEIVPFDEEQSVLAAAAYRVYGRGNGHPARLNFGDCFAYPLAKAGDMPPLYKGDDFSRTDLRSAIDIS